MPGLPCVPGFGFCAITRPLRLFECFLVTLPSAQCARRSFAFAFFNVSPASFGTVQRAAAAVGGGVLVVVDVGPLGGALLSTTGFWLSCCCCCCCCVAPAGGITTIDIDRAGKVALNPVELTVTSSARCTPPATVVQRQTCAVAPAVKFASATLLVRSVPDLFTTTSVRALSVAREAP